MPLPNHQAGLIDGGAGLPPLAVAIGLPVVLAELSCGARARPVVVGLLTAWLAAEGNAHGWGTRSCMWSTTFSSSHWGTFGELGTQRLQSHPKGVQRAF